MITRKFGRTKAHREALLRNLSRSLVLTEKIVTTEPRAKEVRRVVDRWLTLAKRVAGATAAARLSLYRQLLTMVRDQEAARKLADDLAIRSQNRTSGFVTLARVQPRVGDAAPRMQLRMIDTKPVTTNTADSTAPKATQKRSVETKTS